MAMRRFVSYIYKLVAFLEQNFKVIMDLKISDKHVSFETFISLTLVNLVRFCCKISNNKVARIGNIKFLTPPYDCFYDKNRSETEYTIRTTEEIEVKIIDFINEEGPFEIDEIKIFNEVWDDDWININSNKYLEEGYEYKFFKLTEMPSYHASSFHDFFREMLFQRAVEFEIAPLYEYVETKIAMFLHDSIIRNEISNYSYVRIPMTSFEIEELEERNRELQEERKRELKELEDEDYYDPREDANSWMDDPENYWNID
jgi:hypothetical protein